MVGDDAHGDVGLFIGPVLLAGQGGDTADGGLENVGIVIGLLALENHAQTLETHAGVDVARRQLLQRPVGLAVELHEDEVPDLDDLRMALVDHLAAGYGGDFGLVAEVEVDFGTRPARTRLAHLPEIVVPVAADDVVLGQETPPIIVGLLVERHAVLLRTLEHGGVHTLGGQLIDVVQKLPRPLDGLLLEIIAVRPVAEHLEHGVVVGIVAHLLQVVVLAGDTQALLRIGRPRKLAGSVAEENILELVHTRVGEHQRRVALDDHRRRGDDGMALALEKIEKSLTDFYRFHIYSIVLLHRYTIRVAKLHN